MIINQLKNKKDSIVAKLRRSRARRSTSSKKMQIKKQSKGGNRSSKYIKFDYLKLINILLRPAIVLPVLIILAFLVIYPYGKAYIEFETKRSNSDMELASQASWDGSSRLILLGVGIDRQETGHLFVDALSLFVIDPERGEMGLFVINPDIEVFIPEIGKSSTLRTVMNTSVAKGKETYSVVRAVELLLAIKVDRYILADEDTFSKFSGGFEPVNINLAYDLTDSDIKDNKGSVLGWQGGGDTVYQTEFVYYLAADERGKQSQLDRQANFFAEFISNVDSIRTIINLPNILNSFQENISTNISKNEVFQIGYFMWGLRRDQIKLGYTRASSLYKSSNGTVYNTYTPVIESIDKDISSIMYNFAIAKEQARIEIYNGSGIRGMASSRARWLENSGARVVKIGNYDSEDVTKVYVERRTQYPETLSEIERIFDGKVIYSESSFDQKHIGDIIIVIGKSVND